MHGVTRDDLAWLLLRTDRACPGASASYNAISTAVRDGPRAYGAASWNE